MSDRLAWGILGTGNIARQFATGVRASRTGVLAAVGSRSAISASDFATAFGDAKMHHREILIWQSTLGKGYC